MRTKWITVLSIAIVIFGTSASWAKNDAIPTLNLQRLCQVRQSAVLNEVGSAIESFVDSCVMSEQAARDQLTKEWATFPTRDKATCVQPMAYSPSYVEWLVCFQITLEVRKIHEAAAAARRANPNRTPKTCPVVQFDEDGAIAFVVVNCHFSSGGN